MIITEGYGKTLKTIGKYCGGAIPPKLIETNLNMITLQFVTNGVTQRSGFKAIYYFSYKKKYTTVKPTTRSSTEVKSEPRTTSVVTTRRSVITVTEDKVPSGEYCLLS